MSIRMEIKDLQTGCTYIKSGETEEDCISQFQSLFFEKRPYKILWKVPSKYVCKH